MKKLIFALFLAMILSLIILPSIALGETTIVEEGVTLPPAGYDWQGLAGIAGATAFTLLIVQFIKAPLDRLWHIPTRALVYVIAFATLLIAQVFTVGFSIEGLALTAVNAVVAASAAMGAYEVTFGKT